MAKYPFLSDEWVVEARRIYREASGDGAFSGLGPLTPVRVNLVVTEVPFSEGPLYAHVDTSGGSVLMEAGHLEQPDVTVSMDYPTARSLFVSGDAQAVMQAFLSGRIRVDGDLSKLLDPKSGLWPASPRGRAGTGTGPGGPPSQLRLEAPGEPSPRELAARELSARLQEITE
jgi:hypothetical protein